MLKQKNFGNESNNSQNEREPLGFYIVNDEGKRVSAGLDRNLYYTMLPYMTPTSLVNLSRTNWAFNQLTNFFMAKFTTQYGFNVFVFPDCTWSQCVHRTLQRRISEIAFLAQPPMSLCKGPSELALRKFTEPKTMRLPVVPYHLKIKGNIFKDADFKKAEKAINRANSNLLAKLNAAEPESRTMYFFSALTRIPQSVFAIGRAYFHNITVFSAQMCKLQFIPKEVFAMVNLKTLFLRKNDIHYVSSEIGKLTKLSTLNLQDNHMMDLPAELGELPLTDLNIRGNPLRKLPQEVRVWISPQVTGSRISDLPQFLLALKNRENEKNTDDAVESVTKQLSSLSLKNN